MISFSSGQNWPACVSKLNFLILIQTLGLSKSVLLTPTAGNFPGPQVEVCYSTYQLIFFIWQWWGLNLGPSAWVAGVLALNYIHLLLFTDWSTYIQCKLWTHLTTNKTFTGKGYCCRINWKRSGAADSKEKEWKGKHRAFVFSRVVWWPPALLLLINSKYNHQQYSSRSHYCSKATHSIFEWMNLSLPPSFVDRGRGRGWGQREDLPEVVLIFRPTSHSMQMFSVCLLGQGTQRRVQKATGWLSEVLPCTVDTSSNIFSSKHN